MKFNIGDHVESKIHIGFHGNVIDMDEYSDTGFGDVYYVLNPFTDETLLHFEHELELVTDDQAS